ncbi:hypothetical protein J6590_032572 [Homalodisca vitripennis]|nr:hypothetical protein J6590_032572 [Homalodisca vitripennis]
MINAEIGAGNQGGERPGRQGAKSINMNRACTLCTERAGVPPTHLVALTSSFHLISSSCPDNKLFQLFNSNWGSDSDNDEFFNLFVQNKSVRIATELHLPLNLTTHSNSMFLYFSILDYGIMLARKQCKYSNSNRKIQYCFG